MSTPFPFTGRTLLEVPSRGGLQTIFIHSRHDRLHGHLRVLRGRNGQKAMTRPRTHLERLQARDGYFSPESMVRRLGNSPVTPFLGGGAAVLLQVAHPLVACGVVEHSGYDRNLWRRLVRTLQALYLITFGDREEAERAGAAVQAVHARVHGR